MTVRFEYLMINLRARGGSSGGWYVESLKGYGDLPVAEGDAFANIVVFLNLLGAHEWRLHSGPAEIQSSMNYLFVKDLYDQ